MDADSRGVSHMGVCGGRTLIILSILKAMMGLRVSEEEEQMGLDLSQHDERGYAL